MPASTDKFDKKAFRSLNPVDPVSILEIGAKTPFLVLAMSYFGRKLRKGGNWYVADSNAGKKRRNNEEEMNKGARKKGREDTST